MIETIEIGIDTAGFIGYLMKPETNTGKAIIVLTGTDGGIANAKAIAKIFADNGFITLVVGYWKLRGLSKTLSKVPIEYIENATKWLKTFIRVKKIALLQ